MASRAPLVLAAALFVLGMAGLAQTVRQTGHGATPTPLTELAARPLVPSTLSPSPIAIAPTPMDAVSDVVAPSPPPIETPTRSGTTVFAPVPQPSAATVAATATPEPTPEPRSAAIAAGVAADGDETVPASATTNPLHPLHFGMVANGEAAGSPAATATPTPEVTRTAEPAPVATGTPTP